MDWCVLPCAGGAREAVQPRFRVRLIDVATGKSRSKVLPLPDIRSAVNVFMDTQAVAFVEDSPHIIAAAIR